MTMLIAGGLALWLLAVALVLGVCRAAAGPRRLRVGVGVATAIVALPAAAGEADARRAPCANRDVQFEAAPALAQEALVCEIGRVRARRDLRRWRPDERLELAARRHAADMVQRHYFSHVTPGGAHLGDRVRRAGYAKPTCSWRVGEVLAWGVAGQSTAAATVRGWMDSPDHRRILVSRRYSELGMGMVAGTPLERYPNGVTVAAVAGRRHCSA